MITRGLGTGSLFTVGFNKKALLVNFIANNFRIFKLNIRNAKFGLLERLVDFTLNTRLVKYIIKTERNIAFTLLTRLSKFKIEQKTSNTRNRV